MNRISKIIRKDSLMKENSYAVFSETGMVVFNGIYGIRYGISRLGVHIPELISKHGTFAVYDASALCKALKLIGDIKEATIVGEGSTCNLVFKFKGGKGRLELPATLEPSESLDHFSIPWPAYGAKEGAIDISQIWSDFDSLITHDGENQWPHSHGIYGDKNKLKSFDSLAYVEIESDSAIDFFCPNSVISLGLKDIEYVLPVGDGLFLVGKDIQYYTARAYKSTIVEEASAIAALFDKPGIVESSVDIDKSSQTWTRAKNLIDGSQLSFEIKDEKIIIGNTKWQEEIGTTSELPNLAFLIPLGLIERWALYTTERKISIVDDEWYIQGKTANGSLFFARLSSAKPFQFETPLEREGTFKDELI